MQIDDVAIPAATKTVEAALVREDREARGLFAVNRTQALVTVGGPVALELQAVALTVFKQRIVANHRLPVRLLPLFLFGEGA